MSLYQKYRPKDLSQVKGNRSTVTTLRRMLKDKETMPHVFLFHGKTGTGKTTLARILTSELGCTGSNINEIDSAQFRGIDTVRDIRKNSQFATLGGGSKVYIIDEVHKMTGDAQNAFLKILEDTPKHLFFILCTTELNSLLPTIRGRCSQFQTESLDDLQMEELLLLVAEQEGDNLDREVLDQIIIDSQGLPRNALVTLEQVLNTPIKRRLHVARQSAIEQSESIALCRALMKGESWKTISEILKGLKQQDAESVRRVVLGYASAVLLNKSDSVAGIILECFEEPLYNIGFPGLVLACFRVKNYE
jgi:DNA polymerase III gamma/tau subunit